MNILQFDYQNISSPTIQSLIKKTEWEDHQYIDHLILLYKFLVLGIHSAVEGMCYSKIKNDYPIEHGLLVKEVEDLWPSGLSTSEIRKLMDQLHANYWNRVHRQEESTISQHINVIKENHKTQQSKIGWLKAGGK